MNYQERQTLSNRICSGRLYTKIRYKYSDYEVLFKDPSLTLNTYADYIYNSLLQENKSENGDFLTLEESYKKLEEDGKWGKKFENELSKLLVDNDAFSKQLPLFKYQKKRERTLKEAITKNRKRIEYLNSIKNSLWPSTLECFCLQARRNLIVRKIAKILKIDKGEAKRLLSNHDFIVTLSYYYFEKSAISLRQIRELARNDPFRLYWILSKSGGTPLFAKSAVEMSEYQYQLVLWSKIYDNAFESMNRPSDEIIEDDERFDEWQLSERERIKRETEQDSMSHLQGQEVFIPADREGVSEVLKLNSPISQANIKNRQKQIESQNEVKEVDLQDVRTNLILEKNKLESQTMQRR